MKILIILPLALIILAACNAPSSVTKSDKNAEELGILSEDDAEAIVYEQLTDEEKQTLTVDYLRTEDPLYVIRTYEVVDGEIVEKDVFTVNYHSEEVKKQK